DLFGENAFRQAEGGDVGAHEPAGLVVLFKDHDFIAQGQQVVRHGERGGARADAGNTLAVLLCGDGGQQVGDLAAQVGGDALETADGDRRAVHAHAAAG